MSRVVEGDYQIRPNHIHVHGRIPLMGVFGYGELEHVAAQYIKRCQDAGDRWLVLTEDEYQHACGELLKHYHILDDDEDQPYEPNRPAAGKFFLLDRGLMVHCPDGKYRVTDEFIHQCFRGSRRP